MTAADLEDVTRLCTELGYPVTAEEVAGRFALVEVHPDHAAFVVDADGELIAWVHVHSSLLIQSPLAAEIGGVVVTGPRRREGWGRRLIEAAEEWAAEHGFEEILLRSNSLRDEAHDFYPALGYSAIKTSQTYVRKLETG